MIAKARTFLCRWRRKFLSWEDQRFWARKEITISLMSPVALGQTLQCPTVLQNLGCCVRLTRNGCWINGLSWGWEHSMTYGKSQKLKLIPNKIVCYKRLWRLHYNKKPNLLVLRKAYYEREDQSSGNPLILIWSLVLVYYTYSGVKNNIWEVVNDKRISLFFRLMGRIVWQLMNTSFFVVVPTVLLGKLPRKACLNFQANMSVFSTNYELFLVAFPGYSTHQVCNLLARSRNRTVSAWMLQLVWTRGILSINYVEVSRLSAAEANLGHVRFDENLSWVLAAC